MPSIANYFSDKTALQAKVGQNTAAPANTL